MIKLNYDLLKSWKAILLISSISILLFQGFFYLHPANQSWMSSGDFSWSNLLRFLLIDQILLECLSVWIVFRLIILYARWFNLDQVSLSFPAIGLYLVKFLPLLLVSYFIFSPVTLTARFLLHYFPHLPWQIYFQEYFLLRLDLYLVYLIPSLMYGYGGLLLNLLYHYKKQPNTPAKEPEEPPSHLEVKGPHGITLLASNEINWIERKDRKYHVHSTKGAFLTDIPLAQLESQLPPSRFMRINRAAIVNIDLIEGYSFWENEKYVVRLKNGKEFVVSRQRIKALKKELQRRSSGNDVHS